MAFSVTGPTLALRLPVPQDAPVLFRLAADPAVTRWFSWGPYTEASQASAYIAGLPAQRALGNQLDLLVAHHGDGPIGITHLAELSRRDRRAVVGTWLGRDHWATGANAEAKALVAHLAFRDLGLERLGAYTNVDHARSQAALERLGFRREGVLRRFHRHGDTVHDVVVWSLLRDEWQRSPLAAVPVTTTGAPPV